MSSGRALEYTAAHVRAQFGQGDQLDLSSVMKLPTVFACENSWDGNHIPARVGILTNVQLVGREYRLEYVFDPELPPIPNEILFGMAAHDLDIDVSSSIPESSRNHWAIKDVDLFKALLKHQLGQRPKPTVFDLPNVVPDTNLVAVMMPFDVAFDPAFQSLKTAVEGLGMVCQRADDIWVNDHVIQDVALLICRASIVICDLSGRNPNVFYEAGIAHAIGKNVILLAQSKADIPFDVAAIRHLQYLPNSEGLAKLSSDVQSRIKTLRQMP